jgi:hypothetical protein
MGPNQRRRALAVVVTVCASVVNAGLGFFGRDPQGAMFSFVVAGFALGLATAWVADDRKADRAYWEELRRSARELSRQEALDKNSFAGWRRHDSRS